MLGGLNLLGVGGHELKSVLAQPKRVALLAYLAAATPKRLHRRDSLVALFWPELDQEHARAALRQATLLAERGGLAESGQWGRRALRIAPLDEPTLRRLMQTLDGLGDRAGALEAYEAFAKRLTAELETDPAPETRALAGAVRERVATLSSTAGELAPLETRASAIASAVAGVPKHAPARPGPRWWVGAAGGGFGLAAAGLWPILRAPAPAPLNPKRVLVVPLANRTRDSTLHPLGNLAADWITRGLALTGVLEIADPGALVLGGRTGGAHGSRQASHEAADARALSLASGSGLAVWGSLYRRDDRIEFAPPISDEV